VGGALHIILSLRMDQSTVIIPIKASAGLNHHSKWCPRSVEVRTVSDVPQETAAKPRRTLRRRIARGSLRCCQFFLLSLLLYFLAVLVGLIPVNNDFEPTQGGVEIMVTSTAIHADLVLPIRNETMDWSQHLLPSDFTGDVKGATHVAFGWGNKEFYVDTPTWGDVTAGVLFRALCWPSATCMHVSMLDVKDIPTGARKTTISREQYRRLVEHVLGNFRKGADGRFLRIEGGAYDTNDAFYHADGSYHAFNTCNCWVGRGLKVAGVRTGWFTPLPKTVFLYMPAPAE
jgi:uncharacterized protein (TIGR02117 family)